MTDDERELFYDPAVVPATMANAALPFDRPAWLQFAGDAIGQTAPVVGSLVCPVGAALTQRPAHRVVVGVGFPLIAWRHYGWSKRYADSRGR